MTRSFKLKNNNLNKPILKTSIELTSLELQMLLGVTQFYLQSYRILGQNLRVAMFIFLKGLTKNTN